MKKEIVYITGEEIEKLHKDLIESTKGLCGILNEGQADYIAESAVYREDEGICSVAAHLLSRIVKGHTFNDCNKRTGYFTARYFLMRNGADYNNTGFEEVSEDINSIAEQPTMDNAYNRALELCKQGLITDQIPIPDYETFHRLVIKSIGVAKKLSDM